MVLHDLGGGAARFDKLGPWHRSHLLSNAVGAIRSVRPLPSGNDEDGPASWQSTYRGNGILFQADHGAVLLRLAVYVSKVAQLALMVQNLSVVF